MQIQESYITVDTGIRLHVFIYQADTPPAQQRDLVLLHGWPGSGHVWQEFADAVLKADPRFRLLAPSFRGYGNSDKPETGYTCARFAEDVLALLAGLNVTAYSLIGHSMGGKIAQAVASASPSGLQSLILLAPSPASAANIPPERRQEQAGLYGDRERIASFLAGMMAHLPERPLQERLVQDGLALSRTAFTGWIEPMREEDFSPDAGKIAVPTLVILGTRDPLRSEESTRHDIVSKIPNARMATLPGVGHLLATEDPTALSLLVVNFLDDSLPAEVV